MRVKSSCLLLFSLISATEVNWSPLSWIVCAFGIVVIAVSCLGILVSQGVTLCLHVGLWVYLVSEFILVVIEVVLLIAASVKKTEWIDDLTEKYADEKDLERFREEYDDFWPYIIAFGALTVVSSALGLLLAIRVKRQLAVERDDLEGIISDRRPEHVKAKRDEIKKPYKDMSVAMVEKYGDRFNSKNGPK